MSEMFVAVYHSMSVEDPESGTPPEVWRVSADRQKLIDAAKAALEEQVVDEIDMDGDEGDEPMPVLVEEDSFSGNLHIKASFLSAEGEYSTYYVIESADLI